MSGHDAGSVLRFEDVQVALGGRPVLQGITLALQPGEVMVLAGRNGAGKTTLLRVATGVLEPDAGTAHACRAGEPERPLSQFSRRELARHVALVPQETSIPFPFRLLEVVLMGRAPHLGLLGFETRHDVALAQAALERLGIGALADRTVLEVSGGERQLAMVARALAQETPVLLLDEPTSNLDVGRRLEVLERVRALAAEGRAVLVVSHDLGLAARFADRIALLSEGRVHAVGAPDEVLRPDLLREVFGVDTEILRTAEGAPVVVPRR